MENTLTTMTQLVLFHIYSRVFIATKVQCNLLNGIAACGDVAILDSKQTHNVVNSEAQATAQNAVESRHKGIPHYKFDRQCTLAALLQGV